MHDASRRLGDADVGRERGWPLSEFTCKDHSLESRQITRGKIHIQTRLVLIHNITIYSVPLR